MRNSYDRDDNPNPQPKGSSSMLRPVVNGAVITGLVLFLLTFAVFRLGIFYNNPFTPPGYGGYVTRGAIFGSTSFVGVQYGPTSTGPGWLLRVSNVPTTPRSFEEDFSGTEGLASGDNTQIPFSIDVQVRVRPGNDSQGVPWLKRFFEQSTTFHPGDSGEKVLRDTYDHNLHGLIRSYVRQAAEQHQGLGIQDALESIHADVETKAKELTANSPLEVMHVFTGRINYPDRLTKQNAFNLVSQEQTLIDRIKIAQNARQAEINAIDAEGLACSADIIRNGITKNWLAFQGLLAMRAMVESDVPTHLFIEVGPLGVPTVDGLASVAEQTHSLPAAVEDAVNTPAAGTRGFSCDVPKEYLNQQSPIPQTK